MAITLVTSNNGRATSGTSLSISLACGTPTNGLIFSAIECQNGDGITSVTWNGSSTGVTQYAKASLYSGAFYNYWYTVVNPSGTANLTVNWTGTKTFNSLAEVLQDVDQTTPIEADNVRDITSGSNPYGEVTTLSDNAWVVGTIRLDAVAATASAGTTERQKNAGDIGFVLFDKNGTSSPAGLYQLNTTSSAQKYYFRAFSIKPYVAPTNTGAGFLMFM